MGSRRHRWLLTYWGGKQWAWPCKAGGGASGGRSPSKIVGEGRGHVVGGARGGASPGRRGRGRGAVGLVPSRACREGTGDIPLDGGGPSRRLGRAAAGGAAPSLSGGTSRPGGGAPLRSRPRRGGRCISWRGAAGGGPRGGKGRDREGSRKGGGAGGQWSLCVSAGVGRRRRRRGETLRRRWPRPRPPGAESRPGRSPRPARRAPLPHSRSGVSGASGGGGVGRTGVPGVGVGVGEPVRVRVF